MREHLHPPCVAAAAPLPGLRARAGGWRRELRALALAAFVAPGLLFVVPGHWLLTVDPLDVVQRQGGEIVVIQRAAPRLPFAKQVYYTVEIVEVDMAPDEGIRDTIICRDVSRWSLPGRQAAELRILLRAWMQDRTCPMRAGHVYLFRVTIDFSLFGFDKSVQRQSRAVTMPGRHGLHGRRGTW
jgi:hypothetical protein